MHSFPSPQPAKEKTDGRKRAKGRMICSFPQNMTASSSQDDGGRRSCALNIPAAADARNLIKGKPLVRFHMAEGLRRDSVPSCQGQPVLQIQGPEVISRFGRVSG